MTFEMVAWCHFEFSDIWDFNISWAIVSLWLTSTVFNFKILHFLMAGGVRRPVMHQTVVEIWRFKGFQNGGCQPSCIFQIQFLTVWVVKRAILHHHAKFHEDRSIRCWDIAIFVIFKMAAAAILDFQNFEILLVCLLLGEEMMRVGVDICGFSGVR